MEANDWTCDSSSTYSAITAIKLKTWSFQISALMFLEMYMEKVVRISFETGSLASA